MVSSHENSRDAATTSESEKLVDQFLDAIWMERGLSANTLGAYRADLMTLRRGLKERNIDIQDAEKSDLLDFIAQRVEEPEPLQDDGHRDDAQPDEQPHDPAGTEADHDLL